MEFSKAHSKAICSHHLIFVKSTEARYFFRIKLFISMQIPFIIFSSEGLQQPGVAPCFSERHSWETEWANFCGSSHFYVQLTWAQLTGAETNGSLKHFFSLRSNLLEGPGPAGVVRHGCPAYRFLDCRYDDMFLFYIPSTYISGGWKPD